MSSEFVERIEAAHAAAEASPLSSLTVHQVAEWARSNVPNGWEVRASFRRMDFGDGDVRTWVKVELVPPADHFEIEHVRTNGPMIGHAAWEADWFAGTVGRMVNRARLASGLKPLTEMVPPVEVA